MSQSNQNPTFDDDNKIEYFCSIEICGDNGDGENEGRDGEKKLRIPFEHFWKYDECDNNDHEGVKMIRREEMIIRNCSIFSPSLWAFLFATGPRISRGAPGK